MDLNKIRELAGLPAKTAESKKLNEHTVGNFSNGYDLQHKTTKYYSDYFPTGNDYTADDEAGPASAKQGDNAMQKAIKIDKDELNEGKGIHSDLVYKYRSFIKESNAMSYDEMLQLRAYNAKAEAARQKKRREFEESPEGMKLRNVLFRHIGESFVDGTVPRMYWVREIIDALNLKTVEDYENNRDGVDEVIMDLAERQAEEDERRANMD